MANRAFGLHFLPSKVSLKEATHRLTEAIRERGHNPDDFTFRLIRAYDVETRQVIERLDAHEKEQPSGKTDLSQP